MPYLLILQVFELLWTLQDPKEVLILSEPCSGPLSKLPSGASTGSARDPFISFGFLETLLAGPRKANNFG